MAGRFVLDANVLFSARLRDLFLQLRLSGVAHVFWTDAIEEEWTHAHLRARPELAEALATTVRLVREAFPLAYLPAGTLARVHFGLPDPHDEHVAQAALSIDAVLVTFNEADFPEAALDPHGVRTLTPDACLLRLGTADEQGVRATVDDIRARLKSPPVSMASYIDGLARSGCPRFADWLRRRPVEA